MFVIAMNLAEEQGFQVSSSIVVRHLQKLNANQLIRSSNGLNGHAESDQQCEVNF